MRAEPTPPRPDTGPPPGIHVVAKPAGPACNQDCAYCFYLEKQVLFPAGERWCMSDEVLAAFIDNYVNNQPTPEVEFVWQGGEPTLLGTGFFQKVVDLQNRYARQKRITNSIQTNGILLDDEWCVFLRRNRFMVGLSLDGPREVQDRYRRDQGGRSTFDRVIRGLKLLHEHRVEFNVLAAVARETARQPLEVYRFLRDQGLGFIQFTPVVERLAAGSSGPGFRLAGPATLDTFEGETEVAPWSVLPSDYGDFLIAVYEEWVRHDVGSIFVMNFEWALNAWIGNPSPVCLHATQCGRSLVVEHNGEVYACDHCVYPAYRLGNVMTDKLTDLADRSQEGGFGVAKETALPRYCRECEVVAACGGGCPKHRFATTCYDEPGLHYLCEGYRKFFLHIRKYLDVITRFLEHGQPASLVMKVLDGLRE